MQVRRRESATCPEMVLLYSGMSLANAVGHCLHAEIRTLHVPVVHMRLGWHKTPDLDPVHQNIPSCKQRVMLGAFALSKYPSSCRCRRVGWKLLLCRRRTWLCSAAFAIAFRFRCETIQAFQSSCHQTKLQDNDAMQLRRTQFQTALAQRTRLSVCTRI